MIFYESPARLTKTLEQFAAAFGEQRRCCVSREISKLHEEHVRGTLAEVLEHFRECPPKGEIVITVAGADRVRNTVHRNKYRSHDEGEEGRCPGGE